jgi:hypothetical protein
MTETPVGVSPPKEIKKAVSPDEQELAAAQARGVALTGPDGLLKAIIKTGAGVRARGGDERARWL